MEAQRSNLPNVVMVETASLAWEMCPINYQGKVQEQREEEQRKIREVCQKDHSLELFFVFFIGI